MDKTISELRKKIERAKENKGGRKVFAAELREQVVELARAWAAGGKSQSELSRRLGMNAATLTFWMYRPEAKEVAQEARVRPVQVVDAESAMSSIPGARCVVLQSGVRIEGLTMDEVLAVVRALP